mgnify:CR=1 FL=1
MPADLVTSHDLIQNLGQVFFDARRAGCVLVHASTDRVGDIAAVTSQHLDAIGQFGVTVKDRGSMPLRHRVAVIRLFDQAIGERLAGVSRQMEAPSLHDLDRFTTGRAAVVRRESRRRDQVPALRQFIRRTSQSLGQQMSAERFGHRTATRIPRANKEEHVAG